ncbi:glycerol-3-phosphate dehydrogenase/oxidase [Bacteroides coprosuis]|uniref:glycerol-3-phosphate dehydrogenase/oxidase n=1 Tax=Bacteroides coprosuis TaxID=151276 RepID=UPI001DAC9A72|nr:glycerol-3-phosphate dehydrogenase/oxidase [Bacteroides coprosuis]HJD92408.1 glycerol-3-phosphate dehydrogenase/oxidase [Bacteroides coprosuis]
MKRSDQINKIANPETLWDVLIIGGGATGLGLAVDAASRGYKTLLLEQHDFAKSTSSRSTKLVHGGVRYLAQGDVSLVIEALRERGRLKQNAPHLFKSQRFIIGNYKWWEKPFYTIGLTVYDILSGSRTLGRSKPLKKNTVLKEIPQIKQSNLKGGVVYYDGQFDDARLAINLLQTAIEHDATAANYIEVTSLTKNTNATLNGVTAIDKITNQEFTIKAKSIINATGIFVDKILQMDAPEDDNIVRPSQGVHLVVDQSFLGGDSAIMIPKTSDGRVLFGVPWHGKAILGTTDTPLKEFVLEPVALEEEVDFILKTAGQYLEKQPTKEDVLSVFAGLRPLAAPKKGSNSTKEISRSHKIIASDSGLVTVTGGKWTTYREMAEETLDKAIEVCHLENKACVSKNLRIHGYQTTTDRSNFSYVYGSDLKKIQELCDNQPELRDTLHPRFDFIKAEVVWAIHHEMALTIEDVLARRLRALFLDARAAIDIAPKVASIMAKEMNKDKDWENQQVNDFIELAQNYLLIQYKPQTTK